MTRSAAAKATEAADALLVWLRDQPPPVFPRARPGVPDPTPAEPQPGATDPLPDADAAGHPEEDTSARRAADRTPVAAFPEVAEPRGDRRAPSSRQALAAGAGGGKTGDAPLRLAHTDWLHHRLTVTGRAGELAAFQAAAAGAGVIPWQLDPDRLAEDFLHLLVAPPSPHQRSLSLPGARILAGQLRDAVARRHDLAVARVGRSRACPFDLHALVPVPENILRRGPDDPVSLAWLWQHWGTTRELRHVAEDPAANPEPRRRPTVGGARKMQVSFWSADWSPWRALTRLGERFPALRFDLCPSYDPS
jgi:hypothetical protein